MKGVSRSLTNTNGTGRTSRCNRRNARSSTPLKGWTLGVPPLTLRTCRTARLYSTCSQRRPTVRTLVGHAGRLSGSWLRPVAVPFPGPRPSVPLSHARSGTRASVDSAVTCSGGVVVRFTMAGATAQMRFAHTIPPVVCRYCSENAHFRNSDPAHAIAAWSRSASPRR